MINKAKRKSVGIGVGTSSIMMIFVVLVFTVFATLSYVQANANYKMSDRYRKTTEQYYLADTEATAIVFAIQNALDQQKPLDEFTQIYQSQNLTVKDNVVEFYVTINENSVLCVKIAINQEDAKNRTTILQWQMISGSNGLYGNQGFDF